MPTSPQSSKLLLCDLKAVHIKPAKATGSAICATISTSPSGRNAIAARPKLASKIKTQLCLSTTTTRESTIARMRPCVPVDKLTPPLEHTEWSPLPDLTRKIALRRRTKDSCLASHPFLRSTTPGELLSARGGPKAACGESLLVILKTCWAHRAAASTNRLRSKAFQMMSWSAC